MNILFNWLGLGLSIQGYLDQVCGGYQATSRAEVKSILRTANGNQQTSKPSSCHLATKISYSQARKKHEEKWLKRERLCVCVCVCVCVCYEDGRRNQEKACLDINMKLASTITIQNVIIFSFAWFSVFTHVLPAYVNLGRNF